jgi:uncharacterized protein (TIGR02996 family)
MSDGDALLRAILEDPEDDAPRLIYADWLDGVGECDRAEIIRLQIRIAGMGLSNGGIRKAGPLFRRDRQLFELAERELHLLIDSHGYKSRHRLPGEIQPHLDSRWGDDIVIQPNSAAATQPSGSGVGIFARGFVGELRLPTAAFLAHAPALFAAHPVTAVRLTDRRASRGVWFANKGDDDFIRNGLEPADSNWLPWSVAIHLGESYVTPYPRFERHEWEQETPADADAALSAACVAYGRRLAGLPPLPDRAYPPTAGNRSRSRSAAAS